MHFFLNSNVTPLLSFPSNELPPDPPVTSALTSALPSSLFQARFSGEKSFSQKKCEKRAGATAPATAPFPKSRPSYYFRFARFNTFALYYLRAGHLPVPCEPQTYFRVVTSLPPSEKSLCCLSASFS